MKNFSGPPGQPGGTAHGYGPLPNDPNVSYYYNQMDPTAQVQVRQQVPPPPNWLAPPPQNYSSTPSVYPPPHSMRTAQPPPQIRAPHPSQMMPVYLFFEE